MNPQRDIAFARYVAVREHGEQRYKNDVPYVHHLDHVARVLGEAGYRDDVQVLSIAYLHDVLEDTKMPEPSLRALFGDVIADAVVALTEPKTAGPGALGRKLARRERHARAYPRIAANTHARVVKLADRIANVESCEVGEPQMAMYLDESVDFICAITPPYGDRCGPEEQGLYRRCLLVHERARQMSGRPVVDSFADLTGGTGPSARASGEEVVCRVVGPKDADLGRITGIWCPYCSAFVVSAFEKQHRFDEPDAHRVRGR